MGFRAFSILAGAGTVLIAAAVARELGGGRRAQLIAAVVVAFSPLLLATNGLFQPVSFDQLATTLALWIVLRLAPGRGSWLLLGLAVGIGAEPALGGRPRLGKRALAAPSRPGCDERIPAAVPGRPAAADSPRRRSGRGLGWQVVLRTAGCAVRACRRRRSVALWATARLRITGAAYLVLSLVFLPLGLPVLSLRTADRLGVIKARSDYQDEVGWHTLARQVDRLAVGSDVVIADNYGEAGALRLFGSRHPAVASADMTFRFWRPTVTGRQALLVGFTKQQATFCRGYTLVARIRMPVKNAERGGAIARCTLDGDLAHLWPRILKQT